MAITTAIKTGETPAQIDLKNSYLSLGLIMTFCCHLILIQDIDYRELFANKFVIRLDEKLSQHFISQQKH
jgi:hypothetical protein